MDFTLNTLKIFLNSLYNNGYRFAVVSDYLKACKNITKQIILRHDVDARPQNAFHLARIEHSLGIRGTYYFRTVPASYDEAVIREIAGLGHEIGYHYETLAQIVNRLSVISDRWDGMDKENILDNAYQMFIENLEKLRNIVPVETICMHGSPLSRFDNREIWKKNDYRELGIIGEASMDIDFSKVAYYTDTGRRWDGADVSIRDKVHSGRRDEETKRRRDEKTEENTGDQESEIRNRFSSGAQQETNFKEKKFPLYHSTFEMIRAVEEGAFPEQAMLTIHPQRWNDAFIPWAKELVWQNIKNVAKRGMVKLRN